MQSWLWMGMVLWSLLRSAWADEAIHPSQAFRPTIQALDAYTVEVRFHIAPGHYLDKDKVFFSTRPPSATLGTPVAPPSVLKPTPQGGWVHRLTDRAVFLLPVHAHSATPTLRLALTYQGWTETGHCYPPQERILTIALPDPAAPAPPHGGGWAPGFSRWPWAVLAILAVGGGLVWFRRSRRPSQN